MSQQHDMENGQNSQTDATNQPPASTDELGDQPSDGLFERLDSSDRLFKDSESKDESSESSVDEGADADAPEVLVAISASSTQAPEDELLIAIDEVADEDGDEAIVDLSLDDAATQAAAVLELSQLRERYKALNVRFSQLELLHKQLTQHTESQKQESERRIAQLQQEHEAITAERDELKNRVLRAAADLENFRKRKEREKEELRKYGSDRLILEVLPAVDNLERALDHSDKSEGSSTIADGVRMVLRQLLSGLEKHGVKGYASLHERFDPQRHEAIQQIETSEFETGVVMQEFQKGYFLHDRLLRPALVVVAKYVAPPAAEGADDDVIDIAPELSSSAEDDSMPILEEIPAPSNIDDEGQENQQEPEA